MTSTKIHFSGYAPVAPAVASGTACRPDGEYGRRLIATSDEHAVTCLACLKAMPPRRPQYPIHPVTRGHGMTLDEVRRAFGSDGIRITCDCGDEGLMVPYTRGINVRQTDEYVLALASLHRSTGASLLDLANGDA